MRTCFLCLVFSVGFAAFAQQGDPDLILFNGKIFTSVVAQPYVQALAIRGERISATGDTRTIQGMAGPKTKVVDLQGRTAISLTPRAAALSATPRGGSPVPFANMPS